MTAEREGADVEAVERVLGEFQRGEVPADAVLTLVASLLAARERAAKAEALWEAAETIWTDGGYIGGVQWGRADYAGWLRDRAASYADQPAEGGGDRG